MIDQIIINNLLISYTEQGSGVPVIFLHGWRSEGAVWQGIVNKLTSKSENQLISCYAIDLPGFGKSQTPKTPMTVGDYAKVVKQFTEKLELKNVIIVGHSFGGRVGIKFAAKYPELTNQLVLVDAAGFAMDETKKKTFKVLAKMVKPFFKPKFMQGLRKKVYQTIGAEDYVATPELQKTFVNVTAEDLTADMERIFCPTLIITGEHDTDTPLEFGQRMNKIIPHSKFEIIKNAGHFSFIDQPEEFIKIIVNFLK